MSAHVSVRDYGSDIHMVCTLCEIDEHHETWKTANEACRSHNQEQHPRGIQWAN